LNWPVLALVFWKWALTLIQVAQSFLPGKALWIHWRCVSSYPTTKVTSLCPGSNALRCNAAILWKVVERFTFVYNVSKYSLFSPSIILLSAPPFLTKLLCCIFGSKLNPKLQILGVLMVVPFGRPGLATVSVTVLLLAIVDSDVGLHNMDVDKSTFEAADEKDNDDAIVAVILVVLVVAPPLLLPAKLIKVLAMLN